MAAVARALTAFVAERVVEFLLITVALAALMGGLGGRGLPLSLRLVESYYLLSGYPVGALLAWVVRRRWPVHWQALLACFAFAAHLGIFLAVRGLLESRIAWGMSLFLGLPTLMVVAFCAVLGARMRARGLVLFAG
ncbi:hypothetical protein [Nitrospirillum viridazoti]|uniref:Uncharacterized protein n=1 Tax=Nitrospirillum viridazoti CBAmc TaxID=1441467 RepID=A0A248JTF2_9PROT|nr:hypothetical protein [Nitrospirillum amazonense]ASG21514.1 hypothetical protein Y958_12350 [Nitrospirillum amazonense CBAmc]TWB42355.1 hypothetical protein FBZ91_103375 [Nitrospirillum amazonense]